MTQPTTLPQKRICFTNSDEDTEDLTLSVPSKATKDSIASALSSLPHRAFLYKSIEKFCRDYMRSYADIISKKIRLRKFDDEDYIPISLRFAFDLSAPEKVKETTKFQALAEESSTKLNACKDTLKKNCEAAGKLVINQKTDDAALIAGEFVRYLVYSVSVIDKGSGLTNSALINVVYQITMLDPTTNILFAEASDEIKKDICKRSFDGRNVTILTPPAAVTEDYKSICETVTKIVADTLVAACTAYNKARMQAETKLKVDAFEQFASLSLATDLTSMEIDEKDDDDKKLEAVVDERISKHDNKMRDEINTLKKEIKELRGAGRRASLKKKSTKPMGNGKEKRGDNGRAVS